MVNLRYYGSIIEELAGTYLPTVVPALGRSEFCYQEIASLFNFNEVRIPHLKDLFHFGHVSCYNGPNIRCKRRVTAFQTIFVPIL